MTNLQTGLKTLALTDEEVLALDPIACRYARKYKGYYGLEYDDIYSELWIFFMNRIEKLINEEWFNDTSIMNHLGLISNYAKMRVLDLVRYSKTRYNTQLLTTTDEIDSKTNSPFSSAGRFTGVTEFVEEDKSSPSSAFWKSGNTSDDHSLLSVLGLFGEGTREHNYINLMLLELGVITSIDGKTYSDIFGEVNQDEAEDGRQNGMSKDSIISKAMGFANSSSSAYKVVKSNVYTKMCEELGHVDYKKVTHIEKRIKKVAYTDKAMTKINDSLTEDEFLDLYYSVDDLPNISKKDELFNLLTVIGTELNMIPSY